MFAPRFPFEQKMINMISWAYLIANKIDDQDNQVAEIGFYGSRLLTRIIWPYGLSGVAPRGSTLLTMAINANKQNSCAIPTYPQERRRDMKEWEFATGNYETKAETFYDEDGNVNVLAPNGNVNIITANNVNVTCVNLVANASGQTTITSPTITLNGNVVVTGSATLQSGASISGSLTNNGTNVGSSHVHSGVSTGNSNTQGPQ